MQFYSKIVRPIPHACRNRLTANIRKRYRKFVPIKDYSCRLRYRHDIPKLIAIKKGGKQVLVGAK